MGWFNHQLAKGFGEFCLKKNPHLLLEDDVLHIISDGPNLFGHLVRAKLWGKFSCRKRLFKNYTYTPLKTNMDPKNDDFQYKSPFYRGPFSGVMLVFRDSINFKQLPISYSLGHLHFNFLLFLDEVHFRSQHQPPKKKKLPDFEGRSNGFTEFFVIDCDGCFLEIWMSLETEMSLEKPKGRQHVFPAMHAILVKGNFLSKKKN